VKIRTMFVLAIGIPLVLGGALLIGGESRDTPAANAREAEEVVPRDPLEPQKRCWANQPGPIFPGVEGNRYWLIARGCSRQRICWTPQSIPSRGAVAQSPDMPTRLIGDACGPGKASVLRIRCGSVEPNAGSLPPRHREMAMITTAGARHLAVMWS
jgi:hypothetical protein